MIVFSMNHQAEGYEGVKSAYFASMVYVMVRDFIELEMTLKAKSVQPRVRALKLTLY